MCVSFYKKNHRQTDKQKHFPKPPNKLINFCDLLPHEKIRSKSYVITDKRNRIKRTILIRVDL